jgi:hypothetical protein
MTKQNRRQFLGLVLGGLLVKIVNPILPGPIEPWYIRYARKDWTPSPIPGAGQLLTLQDFLIEDER